MSQQATVARGMMFGLDDLPRVRRMTGRWAAHACLSSDRAADFVLAVHEVALNAVRYGSAEAELVLRTAAGGVAEAEVRDQGSWQPGAVAPVPAARGGMGLRVVRLLCDEVEIRAGDDSTVVLLRMRLAGR